MQDNNFQNPVNPQPVNPQPVPDPIPEITPQPQVPEQSAPTETVTAQQVVNPVIDPNPVAQAPAQQMPPVLEMKKEGSGKPAILIVEDEKDALDLYVYSIQSTGSFEVFRAMDGDEALIQLSQNKIDLVLLDIMMPKKDGVETLAEMKKGGQMYGNPKVVMLTNIGGDIAIDKSMSLGADGYMLKSEIEPMELIGIIKQYLNMPT
ncbi:response regulator [Candidatus Dojkabacteria bacterium]|nr:response regulator [Candidatus Dojkabacteria bacterium]